MCYKQEKNLGFTLIELLVGLAIACIISFAVFTFMLTGSKEFNETNRNTDLQAEIQFSDNIVGEAIMSGEKDYTVFTKDNTGKVMTLDTGKKVLYYNENDSSLAIYDDISTVGSDITNHIISDKVVGFEIEYVETDIKTSGTTPTAETNASGETVYKAFSNLVKVTIKYQVKNKSYTSVKEYRIRN